MSVPPQSPAKGGVSGLAAKAGGKRNILIAAAVGTAAVAFLMARSSGGTKSSGAGADQIMYGYDSTPYDQYNSLQNQLEDIQRQIDEGRVVPGTPTTPTPTPGSPKPKPPPDRIMHKPPEIPRPPTGHTPATKPTRTMKPAKWGSGRIMKPARLAGAN